MEEERGKAAALIELAVDSTEATVDPRLLKAIKTTVRYSDWELRSAAETLMSLMKRYHSQVRYLALLIIDELFMRSKLFRSLLMENLDQLLSLSIGFRRDHPLPPPTTVAFTLRSKAIEFLEKWNESFGIHYRQLRLGHDYLKNTLRLQFPNLRANAARREQEKREREMKTREILLKKFESFKAKFSSMKEEIQINIAEIDECLEILATDDDDVPFLDNEEMEEFQYNAELRQLRQEALREGEKLHENNENEVVFDALREFYKVLVTKHQAAVQDWISLLIRVETEDTSFRDSALKNLIDIRNLIQSTKTKCEKSGCDLSKTANAADDEEDIWEEGTTETFDREKSGPSCSRTTEAPTGSTSKISGDAKVTNTSSKGIEKKNNKSSASKSNPLRDKLMDEAPVLNWGSSFDNWGSNRDVLANQRGLELDGHWGRVDYDAVIPAEKIAELNVHASVYKPEPVETLPCKAPLRKGGLCPRRDLRVCPFHGPIVPRDDKGNPINETHAENQTEKSTPDVDAKLMHQLFKQAAKNVRERDKEEAKQRELNEKALKKARLAKVREHNQSVLKDAAIASTSKSYYVGEDTSSRPSSSAKAKRPTLASMLKRKETSKQRLTQRLLNTRVREATIRQMTGAEDASYREAFPNQW